MMPIFFTEHFKHQLRQLQKKFSHAKEDLLKILEAVDLNKQVSIGRGVYKIRIGSRDMKRGKSGAFRCYVYFYRKQNGLVPLCIYAKSDQESITEGELNYHFVKGLEELASML